MYAVSKPNLSINRGNGQEKELKGKKKKLSIPIHRCKPGLNISSCLLWPIA